MNRLIIAAVGFALAIGMVATACGGKSVEGTTPTPPPATVAPSGFFESDGLMIHYDIYGEGKPLILLHGYSLNAKSAFVDTKWVESLMPGRQVITMDSRGHGQSDKSHDPAAYSYGVMAQDVLNLMDYLKIDKADVLGASMGAFTAVYLLGHNGDRLTSMVLGRHRRRDGGDYGSECHSRRPAG